MIDSLQQPAMPPERAPVRVTPASERSARDFRDAVADAPMADTNVAGESQHPDVATHSDESDRGLFMLLPWQLTANNTLSQLLQLTTLHDGSVPPAAATGYAASARAGQITPPGIALLNMTSSGTAAESAMLPAAIVRVDATAPRAAAAARTSPAETGALLSQLAEQWQARLARWTESGLHGLTVRIRDYRLDADAQTALANQLQAFAQANGMPLNRILINARELWHAGALPSHPQGHRDGR